MKKPYQIRIEPDLLAEIQNKAKKNFTSVNQEIRTAIRQYLKNGK